MAISMDLRVLARKLEKSSDDLLVQASTKGADTFEKVATAVAAASTLLEGVADDMDKKATFNITPQQLDELAALASAFDESGDPLLKKQASVLDELLLSIAAPKDAAQQIRSVTDDEIKRLREEHHRARNEESYIKPREELHDMWEAKAQAKAVEQQVKRYIPLEAPLQTRYPPDRPGGQMTRITDHVYQDIVTGIIYDYKAGYTTQKGNKVPGSSVENQTRQLADYRNQSTSLFETRQSLMGRYASGGDLHHLKKYAMGNEIANALIAVRDKAPRLLKKAIDMAREDGLSPTEVGEILGDSPRGPSVLESLKDIDVDLTDLDADNTDPDFTPRGKPEDRILSPEESAEEYRHAVDLLTPIAAAGWHKMVVDHLISLEHAGLRPEHMKALKKEFLSGKHHGFSTPVQEDYEPGSGPRTQRYSEVYGPNTIPAGLNPGELHRAEEGESARDSWFDTVPYQGTIPVRANSNRHSLVALALGCIQELAPHLLKASIAKAKREGLTDNQIKSVLVADFHNKFKKTAFGEYAEIKTAESLFPHLKDLGWTDLILSHLKVMSSFGVNPKALRKLASKHADSFSRLKGILKLGGIRELEMEDGDMPSIDLDLPPKHIFETPPKPVTPPVTPVTPAASAPRKPITFIPSEFPMHAGKKRTPEEMEDQKAAIINYIRTNPGKTIHEIKAWTGLSDNLFKGPFEKAYLSGKVQTDGQRFFPAGAPAGSFSVVVDEDDDENPEPEIVAPEAQVQPDPGLEDDIAPPKRFDDMPNVTVDERKHFEMIEAATSKMGLEQLVTELSKVELTVLANQKALTKSLLEKFVQKDKEFKSTPEGEGWEYDDDAMNMLGTYWEAIELAFKNKAKTVAEAPSVKSETPQGGRKYKVYTAPGAEKKAPPTASSPKKEEPKGPKAVNSSSYLWERYQEANGIFVSQDKAKKLEEKMLARRAEERAKIDGVFSRYKFKGKSATLPASFARLPATIKDSIQMMCLAKDRTYSLVQELPNLVDEYISENAHEFFMNALEEYQNTILGEINKLDDEIAEKQRFAQQAVIDKKAPSLIEKLEQDAKSLVQRQSQLKEKIAPTAMKAAAQEAYRKKRSELILDEATLREVREIIAGPQNKAKADELRNEIIQQSKKYSDNYALEQESLPPMWPGVEEPDITEFAAALEALGETQEKQTAQRKEQELRKKNEPRQVMVHEANPKAKDPVTGKEVELVNLWDDTPGYMRARAKAFSLAQGWSEQDKKIRDDAMIRAGYVPLSHRHFGPKGSSGTVNSMLYGVRPQVTSSPFTNHRGKMTIFTNPDEYTDMYLKLKEKYSAKPERFEQPMEFSQIRASEPTVLKNVPFSTKSTIFAAATQGTDINKFLQVTRPKIPKESWDTWVQIVSGVFEYVKVSGDKIRGNIWRMLKQGYSLEDLKAEIEMVYPNAFIPEVNGVSVIDTMYHLYHKSIKSVEPDKAAIKKEMEAAGFYDPFSIVVGNITTAQMFERTGGGYRSKDSLDPKNLRSIKDMGDDIEQQAERSRNIPEL